MQQLHRFLDCSTTDMASFTSLATRPTVLPAAKQKWQGEKNKPTQADFLEWSGDGQTERHCPCGYGRTDYQTCSFSRPAPAARLCGNGRTNYQTFCCCLTLPAPAARPGGV